MSVQEFNVLLCYVEGMPEPPDIELLHDAVVDLSARTSWLIAAPEFVNEGEDEDRTVGMFIRLPKLGIRQDPVADARALADAEALIEAAESLTSKREVDLAFELDGVMVGWVTAGSRDSVLEEGLLAPWRRGLEN